MHGDRPARDAEDRREQIARLDADFPPALVPRAHASPAPLLGELREMRARTLRHRPERMTHEVRARFDDGKFWAPAKKRIHVRPQAIGPRPQCPMYSARTRRTQHPALG